MPSLFDEWQQNSLLGQSLGAAAAGLANPASALLAGTTAYGSLTAPPVATFRALAPSITAAFDPLGSNPLSPTSRAVGGFGAPPRAALGRLSDALGPASTSAATSAADSLAAFGARGADLGAGSPFGARSGGTLPGADNPYGLDRTQFGAENPMGRFYSQALDSMQKLAQQYGWNAPGQPGSALTGAATGAATGATGKVGTGLGQFDAGADADIARAAADHGVPANFLKSIVARESSGDWADNAHWVSSVRGGARIYGYVGVFEDAARSWGFDFDALNGNRLGQLEMLATGLRRFYDGSPNHDWLQAAAMHFSGDYNTGNGYGDELGNNTQGYVSDIATWWKQLDASVGQPTNTGASPGGGGTPVASGGINAVTGGQAYPITQEFGPTDWSMGAGAYMYGYGAAYGVQGHPGLDVGTPRGTKLYAPVGGTVQIAGGQPYYTFYGNGAPGVGELLIQLDNGDQLILGHMEQITVPVGTRVGAGSYVGLSGGDNGDHVHIEVRKRGGNTSSGYTAVDPRTYLGGAFVSTYGGSAPGAPAAAPQPPPSGLWWLNLYR